MLRIIYITKVGRDWRIWILPLLWRVAVPSAVRCCTVLLSLCICMLVQYCRTDTTFEWLDTTRMTRTGHETMVYGSYRSRKYPVEQTMVTCISLVRQHFNQESTTRTTRTTPTTRTGHETQWFTSRTIGELHRYLHIYIPTINNSVELFRAVNGSRNKHAKDNACPKGQNKMNIPRSTE